MADYSLDQLIAAAGGADATLRIGGYGAADRVDAGRAALPVGYCESADPSSWSPFEMAKVLFCGVSSAGAVVGGVAVDVADKITDPAEAAYGAAGEVGSSVVGAVGEVGSAVVGAAGEVWERGQDLSTRAIDTVDGALSNLTNPLGLGAVSFGAVAGALVVGSLVAVGADLAFNGGAGARSLVGLGGSKRR